MATIDVKDAAGTVRTIEQPNANGQSTKAGSRSVTLASDDDVQTKLGATTETAPASDNAAAGLNGRLQRVAQRMTAMIALLPATIGIKTGAGSLSVALASDHAALPLPTGAATGAKQDTGNTSLGSIDTKLPALAAGKVPVDGSGSTQPISAAALPLPTGAATGTKQDTGNTSLGSIDTKLPTLVTGRVPVDGSAVTQPISAIALPLPTGAATGAKQDAGNTSLGSIDTKMPTLVTGRMPVDGSGVTQPVSASALPLPTGAATGTKQDTGNTSLQSVDAKLPALVTGRMPVDGSGVTQPVSAAALPLPTGAATGAKQDALTAQVGEVQAVPTANTILDRLKTIATALAGLLKVDTIVAATPTDRGAVIGFSGALISTTNASTTITLTTAATTGALVLGQQLTATGVTAGTLINTLASGTLGAAGSTYTLSAAATATGTGVAASSVGPQQIMAVNAARRGFAFQVQSTSANVWVNAVATATANYRSLKVPAGTYYENPPTHVSTTAFSAIADTAATPLYAREW